MHIKGLFIVFLSCALMACGQGDQTASQSQQDTSKNSAADRVLSAYRVGGMLEQSAPIITDALAANLPAAVSEAERKQLEKAITEVYTVEELFASASKKLTEAAGEQGKEEDLKQAAEALEQELVQTMVDLDEAAATDEFAEAFDEFLNESPPDDAKARLEIIKTLVDDLHLVELQTVFNIGMMRGMIVARNAAAPEDYSMSSENADKMVKQTREGLNEHLSGQLPMMLLFAYRDVEPEKLAEYKKLQDSEVLRWVNGAMVKALGQAYVDAAQQLPKRYKQLTNAEDA